MTVLGPVSPSDLGITLAHEHCLIDLSVWFVEPEEASRRANLSRPIDMTMLAELRRRPFSTTRDNVTLNDEGVAIEELERYALAGGRSIVDVTPIGLGRDPSGLQRISRATGLHIVMGTSFYVENAHPDWVAAMDADSLSSIFIGDIVAGPGTTGVRAGVIGEIGLSGIPRHSGRQGWGMGKVGTMTSEEEKVLRAAARASQRTGVTISLHIDRIEPRAALPALQVLLHEEHVPPDRIIVGHMDQVAELDYHLAVASHGVFCEYDSFGREHYSEEWGSLQATFGHDPLRVALVGEMVDRGHAGQLLFSQDVCLKMDLQRFGGAGYAHVLNNIVPTLREMGIEDGVMQTILVDNPARAFAYTPHAYMSRDLHD